MKALVLREYGDAEKLVFETEYPKPSITKPTEMIIKVKAASINPVDFKLRKGYLSAVLGLKFPAILGLDYSGIVESVGTAVVDFKVNDQVFGKLDSIKQGGSYAEYVLIDTKTDAISKKPDCISFEEAACVGVAGLTACVALIDHGKLVRNDSKRVLVIGASGGVGSFGVQIAKLYGANVTGICSSHNMDYVKSLGADTVLDYKSENFRSDLQAQVPFDIIFDCVGGDDYFNLTEPLLVNNGMYSTAVGPEIYGGSAPIGISTLVSVASKLIWRKICGRTSYQFITALPIQRIKDFADWYEKGEMKPSRYQSYPLQDGSKAHLAAETNRTVGKIILQI